ncbi:MAG TPA: ABC transporter permease [Gemmatimonadales bacterium]|nr:ABC transporter permease [Gemmatimonadales bacterium]
MSRRPPDPLPLSNQKPVDEDVRLELAQHIELRTEELVARGWSPEEARAEAVRAFGDLAAVTDECREITVRARRSRRRDEWFGALIHDVRFALRILRRSPAFTCGAVLTLALGIGANTAIFSVVNGVLLRPLPYDHPEELVSVYEATERGGYADVTEPNFRDWRAQAHSFDGMAAYGSDVGTLLGADIPSRVRTAAVSEDFFRVMRVQPALGRLPAPDEHRTGAPPVAVVSYRFWRDRLGGTAELANRRLRTTFDFQVVGVLPPGFGFPDQSDLWFPVELYGRNESRTAHNFSVVARLRPGLGPQDGKRELDALTAPMREQYLPEFDAVGASVAPLQDRTTGSLKEPLYLLLGASSLLLIAACTNLASSMLVRGSARAHELAIRAAIGAGRGRLVRQVFTESLLISSLGCAAGLAVAVVVRHGLLLLAPAGMVPLEGAPFDVRVLGFSLLLTLLTAVLFGLLPAMRMSSVRPSQAMREGTRHSGSRRSRRLWSTLVAVEVALAVVLLCGSGLLLRSFAAITSIDPGFHSEGVITTLLDLPDASYPDVLQAVAFHDRLLAELQGAPGVLAVGITNRLPLEGDSPSGAIQVEGKPLLAIGPVTGFAIYRTASAGYFEAMGMRLVTGRSFTDRDRADAAPVVIVTQSLADREWPGEDPLGRQLRVMGMDDAILRPYATVVGVVADIPHGAITGTRREAYWYPYSQMPARTRSMNLVVRTAGDPAAAAPMLAEAVHRLDPQLPLEWHTMEERLSSSIADRRFTMVVLASFALVALLLAGLGIYGVVSYTVAQRGREIGIRIALGAEPSRVQRLVQGGAMAVIGIGIVAGGAGAVAGTRLMRTLLYGVEPGDPVSFALAVGSLVAVGFLASWVPARRSAGIDPVRAIQAE